MACVLWPLLSWGSGTAFAQTTPIVKAYVCPAGTVQAVADRLQKEFGATPGVKIVVDERTSQVIAYAPAEIQPHIGQRLGVLTGTVDAPSPGGPQRLSGSLAPAAGVNQSRTVSLQHCTAEQLEASLRGILNNRLVGLPSPRPQTRRYRVASGSGNVELTIDPGIRQIAIEGPVASVETCARLILALDSSDEAGGRNTRLVPLRTSKPSSIQRAVSAIHDTTGAPQARMPMASMRLERQNQGGASLPAGAANAQGGKSRIGLANPVEIESLEGIDVLVLRGKSQDVEQVLEIIKQIERISVETEPAIEVLPLRQADCNAMGDMIRKIYDEVYLKRQGEVNITSVVKPNALLIVGRKENVQTVVDLVAKMDHPVAADSQPRWFALRHATAAVAQATIQDFYKELYKGREGLAPQVRVTADSRTNTIFIQACPRDMEEAAGLIEKIDTQKSEAINELRIIQLEHSTAKELVSILESAIGTATTGGGTSRPPSESAGQRPPTGGSRSQNEQRSAMLRFLTIDTQGRRLVQSGILGNVKVTSDDHANAVVVSAPAECIELIEALIRQLDGLPAAEANIKVFTIVNSDAANLKEMLSTLFGNSAAWNNRGASTPSSSENSLVPLRFAVDARTNSIIASGSTAELNVVEAILMRLDDGEVRQRKNFVFRLKNSYAKDVAQAVSQFLTQQRQMQREQTPGMTSAFEQIEREVVVVPELGSNSLILSATPRFFEEVKAMIEQLDVRPPMVMIQVLIARVDLDNTDEFGIELGLQDGLLFDRSLLSNPIWKSTTITNPNQQTQTTNTLIAANNTPGFNFNNSAPLGNSGAANAVANATSVGSQGLSNFGVGRANKAGVSGLVLSASSESVNILLRALSQCHRMEVLQRPQIMTLDNQPAYIRVGEQVPVIQDMTTNQFGGQNFRTSMMDVGVVLGVTPRISPDGLVVIELDATRSEVGDEAQGTPVAVSEGVIIRSPRIEGTYAQTTVSAMSGQTVVLGGLIAKSKEELHRKVPLLGDIPVLGYLFRFDSVNAKRSELMIIMTPHIVRNEADADAIKQAEAARMSWCLSDVTKIHGDVGLRGRTDNWSDAETQTVYPDMKPALGPDGKPLSPEMIPTPATNPAEKPSGTK